MTTPKRSASTPISSGRTKTADVRRYKGEYRQAIEDYTEAIRLSPNLVDAYNSRGDAYREEKEYDRAIGDYTEGDPPRPQFLLGVQQPRRRPAIQGGVPPGDRRLHQGD